MKKYLITKNDKDFIPFNSHYEMLEDYKYIVAGQETIKWRYTIYQIINNEKEYKKFLDKKLGIYYIVYEDKEYRCIRIESLFLIEKARGK